MTLIRVPTIPELASILRQIAFDVDSIRERGRASLTTREYKRLGAIIDGLRLVAQRLDRE